MALTKARNSTIDDTSVDTEQLVDASVTAAKLAPDTVDSTKLADDAVGNEHMQDNSVGTSELQDGSVTEAKLNAPSLLSYNEMMWLQDLKPNGDNGQTLTANTYNTRDLAQYYNSIDGSSVVSNQIFLPAGTYIVDFGVCSCDLDLNRTYEQLYFWNVTFDAPQVLGTSHYNQDSEYQGTLEVKGVFTTTSTTAFEVRHWVSPSDTSGGRGPLDTNGYPEVYLNGFIYKVG